MRNVLLAVLLLIQSQSASSPVANGASLYPGFHPKSSGPFSFEIDQPSREAFETIAVQAGLNVVFLRDFQSQPVQLKLDKVSITEALDALCAGSNSFWQPYDSKTILVANDSTVNHRDLDLQRIAMFYLKNVSSPQQMIDIMNTVRQELSPRSMTVQPGPKVIVMKDAPEKVLRAEKRISDLDKSEVRDGGATFETDIVGNVFVIEGGDRRNFSPSRSRLQPSSTGPFSFDINQSSRSAFEAIAAKAGLTAVFDRDYPDSNVSMKLNDVDIDAALDLVSMASGNYGSFWQPFGARTIFIANGTSTKHRDYDSARLDVIHLNGPKTAQEVNDVMNATRQTLNVTTMVALPRTNTLILKDTPAKLALAEKLIAELDGRLTGSSAAAVRAPIAPDLTIEIEGAGALYGSGAALFNIEPNGVRRNITPNRSQLQPKTTRPFSLRMTEDVQRAFEILGETGGINVRFDPNFKPGAGKIEFRLDNVDLFDALDILSLQTGSFWQVVDNGTIVVAVDNYTVRQAIEPQVARTFHLTNAATPQESNDILNSLRQMLNLTGITANPAANTIEVRDTVNKITLSEKLIGVLDKPTSPR